MKKTRSLGQLAIMALALTAFLGISSASASTFKAEQLPVVPRGENTEALTLYTAAGVLECGEWLLNGNEQEAGESLTMAAPPSHPACSLNGLEVAVSTDGCEFRFKAGSEVEIAPEYFESQGTMDIVGCKSETGMGVNADGLCTITIPPQTGIGPVHYENAGEGRWRSVMATLAATNVEANLEGFWCGFGRETNGGYLGAWRVKGTDGSGNPQGLWRE